MTNLRRAIAAALLGITVTLVVATLAYRVAYRQLPPTHLNLLLWIGPAGDACLKRAPNPERAPLLGTGVGLGEICPGSKYGPGNYGIFDHAVVWVILVGGLSAALAWGVRPRRERTVPRRAAPEARWGG